MSFTTWFSLFSVCLMGAMFPGSSLALVLRQTISNSRAHGIVTGVFHALGMGMYATFAVMGLVEVLQHFPIVFKVLSYLGGSYLLWLGYQGITAKNNNQELFTVNSSASNDLKQAARSGFLMALLNPKVGLYFLALFSQFIYEGMSFFDKLLFVITIMLVDGGWYTVVVLMVSKGKMLAWLRQHQLWIERTLGIVLILLAFKLIWPSN